MSSTAFSCCITFLCLLGAASAFGAGNIPSYGALEGIAFRHGDIEDILLQLAMVPVGSGTGGFLSAFNPLSSSGKKFNAMAVKRVYFGNWLRDYSQAVDVGTLSKGLDSKTIRLLVWVMGFMAFGYATEEFEVTDARLGVYRPEEHIDNPKGYPNPEEPDARKFDPRLRGPVQQTELDIDTESGMKNYIANDRGGWMTSSSYVRNSLVRSIELGRAYKQNGGDAEKYESLRVLGQALHTLEAHSNFCELTLIELGYKDVFPQVGTSTTVQISNGRSAFPLTTGTFGGLDFVHSLLGEATDKISQTQITEVTSGLASSSVQGSQGLLSSIQSLTSSVPGFSMSRDLDQMQEVSREADALRTGQRSRATSGLALGTDVDEIARKIYPIMAFRDRIMKGLSAFFDKIPGLSALIDQISEALTVWVLSTIEPFMKPIVEKVTSALGAGQSMVTSKDDQLAVFEDPHCSDPTHSMLAKDHFSCYLNHPAGLIGQAVVKHAVSRVTAAWSDFSINPLQIIEEILEVFHHPALPRGRTSIQGEMRSIVEYWVNNLGSKRNKVLTGLTFDGVKQGLHHEGGSSATTGAGATHNSCHSTAPHNSGAGPMTTGSSHQSYGPPAFNTSSRPPRQSPPAHGNGSHHHGQRPSSGHAAQEHSGSAASYYGNMSRDGFGPAETQRHEPQGRWQAEAPQPYSGQADFAYSQTTYQDMDQGQGRPYDSSQMFQSPNYPPQIPAPGPGFQQQTYGDAGDWTRPQAGTQPYGNPGYTPTGAPYQDPRYDNYGREGQNYGRNY